ncbi:nuclear pore complex protein nup153 [Daphnia sinensis]|uniref:Nuclear pore complex protein Nup153 n=1 Tax=Daphnia sinensis TaxID=1820382 RepID=A0AAD5KXF5_9CRUS|nr:nuclear pore complex protein nup153 [Daphnia sinensis]
MWEDNLGKVKARRSKNSKPYERPKSILRRVTDSVTGLLPQPSWLVNWLQSTSPKKEDNENEEVEQEQPVPSTSSASNGSSSYQEGVERESFIFRRPPGTSREQNSGRAVPDVPALDLFPDPVVVESTSREQLVQTNGDDDSNSESTSGCSSLLPHPEHKRENRNVELPSLNVGEPLSINQSSLQIIGSSLSKSLAVDLKSSRGRKTLSLHTFGQESNLPVNAAEESRFPKVIDETAGSFFDKEDTSLNRSANKRDISLPQLSSFGSKRPRFNVTSFGPTAAEARRSLLNDSVADSPFYAGRTTYGGASAYRRAALQPSTTLFPYVRNRIQARPASVASAPPTPSGSVSTTSSSNVVLSSSAQRILQALEAMSTPVRDAKRIPATSASRRSVSSHDDELSFTGFGLSRRRPNLGPPTSKLSVGTPAQIVSRPAPTSIHPLESAAVSSTPISTQAGGKMRMRTSAPVRKSAPRIQEDEDNELEELAAVPMPLGLTSLPSFNLLPSLSVAPTVASSSVKTLTSAGTSSNGLVHSAAISVSVSRPTFTFSAPLVTVSSYEVETTASSKPPSFNFSSPLLVKPATEKAAEKEPVRPMESNLKSGSVLEVLRGKTQEVASATETAAVQIPATSGFGEKFKPPTDSWTCPVCCVTNPKSKTSCLACESPAPAPKPASTVPIAPKPTTTGFGDQFKMAATQWECSVCMVRNSDTDNRCKSCEEPRPGTKPAVAPSAVSTFKFGIQPTQTSTKFGTESSASSQATGFSFGLSNKKEDSSAGFKFGVSSEVSKEVKETPGFKFGNTIEPKKVESGPTAASTEPASTEKGGFKFGASIEPSKTTAEPVRGFKFGNDKKSEETNVTTPIVSTESAIKPIQLFGFKSSESTTNKAEETSAVGQGLTSDSSAKPETEPQVFKVPALVPQATTGISAASTTTTPASKASPIFSFGTAPVVPVTKTSILETGSVMDILGKKPTAPLVAGQAPVTSAPTFSFGASDQTKTSFSFGSTEKPTLKPGTENVGKEAETSKSSLLAPTTSSTSFSFTGAPTSTSSEGLFKPAATPAFNFGGPTTFGGVAATTATTFGVPSTTATSLAFGMKSAGTASTTFGLPPATTAPVAFGVSTSTTAPTTFGLPAISTAPSTFGTPTTSAPTTTFGLPATSAATTTFGLPTTSAATTTFGLPPTSAAPTPFGLPTTSAAPTAFGLTTSSAAPTTFGLPTTSAAPIAFGLPTTSAVTTAAVGSVVPASSSSIFTFGSSTGATTTSSSSSGFSFGLAPSSSQAPFSFGAAAPPPYQFPKETPKLPSSNVGGFGFGASATAATTSSTPAGSVFSFGSGNVASATTATPSEAPKLQFSFGTPQETATSTAPTFGSFGASATTKTTAAPFMGFNSSTSSTPAFGEMGTKSSVTPFGATPFGTLPPTGFGAAAPSSSSTFSFGAQPSGATAPPTFNAASSFNFGAPTVAAPSVVPQQPTGLFQFGSAPTPAVNSGFNFAPSPGFTTPDAPSPGFASGFLGANPFDNTGSAGGPNRKIRKAVRRR